MRAGLLRKGREQADALDVMRTMHVVPLDPEMALRQFSGGNQQKAILGKWCDRVLVFGNGRVRQEIAGDDLTTSAITTAAYLADTATGAVAS
ncbi:MAG: hypothetical protein ACRDY3_03075 [Acidimicrobiales bacterium]